MGTVFDPDETRHRIRSQLNTLKDHQVRHVVLSAFGCGAFRNPATQVAKLYREEIEAMASWFSCVAFAIFYPGYGPDNYTPFRRVFDGFAVGEERGPSLL